MKTRLVLSLAAASLLVIAAPSMADRGDDGRVLRAGTCDGASTAKLKAKPDDGRLEVEFEVDQNRNGVKWDYRIRRNGRAVAAGSRTTKAPSGSFSVERKIANPAGSDRISAVATRNGETCRASLRI